MRQYVQDLDVLQLATIIAVGCLVIGIHAAASSVVRRVRAWRNQPVVLSDYCQRLLEIVDIGTVTSWVSEDVDKYSRNLSVNGFTTRVAIWSTGFMLVDGEAPALTSTEKTVLHRAVKALTSILIEMNALEVENKARHAVGLPPKTQL